MERGIVANASLDYIEFQAFPSQNRYEACAYLGNEIESVASGPLTQLLRHSDKVKVLHSNGSVANIKFQRPANLGTSKWFSKSTLQRFLHVIASSNGLNSPNAILDEISQLEEARRFHISLYSNASTPKVETESISADASKNELVRAMDLRLVALRGELASAVDKAAGGTCSSEDVIDLMKLSNYLGDPELGKTLGKFVEMFHGEQIVDLSNPEEDSQITKPEYSDTPVKYGVSPAKAAQAERQCSSESEESSYSSEEDRPVPERSRAPIRCASPRRSASPMRRIQIGRSGSRRSTPLTIKSIPYIRERIVSHKETASDSSDDEQKKKPEINITRLSVQDAVKLFENKQKEQTVDGQKDRSLSNEVIGANKSVLRRWSAGTGESSKYPSDNAFECAPTGPSTLEGEEGDANSSEAKPESKAASNDHSDETLKVNVEIISPRCNVSSTDDMEEAIQPISMAGIGERVISSAEWSRQKEAELNQLLMKMTETKPTKYQSIPNSGEKKKNQFDPSKEKKDLKPRGAPAGKKAEKEKQARGMQQILDERISAGASKISSVAGGHENAKKPQKTLNAVSKSTKPKAEAPKPAVIKRSTQKPSPLPAIRKSWPSMPSPRGTVTNSAATVSVPSAGATNARRKSQPTPSAPLPNPKVEKSQLRQKPAKASQGDLKKTTKPVSEKNLQSKVKSGKTTKTIQPQPAADPPPPAKPSLYRKVAKKSSVVPLESKPFLKKGTGVGSGVSPTVKTKASFQPEISVRKSGDLILTKEDVFVPTCPSTAIEQAESDVKGMKVYVETDIEIATGGLPEREEQEIPDKIMTNNDDTSERIVESPLISEAEEETMISPAAWEEIEEQEHQTNQSIGGSISQIESASNSVQAKMPSPRVRYSLSQMLSEEINDPHVIEWGNAENPPSIIYQKDAPKGFKRLLKFARKSKTDASSSGWSSPSVFSEGEDDTEDSKAMNKKNAGNLLKKATLRSLESYEDNSANRELSAQANTSNSSSQTLSQRLREGHASAPVTSTKASRSFFSLSAFKGGN